MPGVPSGRGCDVCRAQKKKCDLQQPVCSRCRKTGNKCVGAGARRFKFLDGNRWAVTPSKKQPPIQLQNDTPFRVEMLYQTPSSDASILAQALVARLRPWEDLSHHMAWAYGPFVTYLPGRLGVNEALDAATRTLLSIHMEACTYSYQRTHQAVLTEYTNTIKTVRKVLDDPVKAWETETLAAVVVLAACQARFDGPLANFTSTHCVGAAHLLKARKFPTGDDAFENMLLCKIRSNMAIQAVFNPELHLTPDDWRQLEHTSDMPDYEARLYRACDLLGELVTRGRAVVAYHDPAEHAAALRIAATMQQDLGIVRRELEMRLEGFGSDYHLPYCGGDRARGLLLRNAGAAAAFEAMLFCVRRALVLAWERQGLASAPDNQQQEEEEKQLDTMCATSFWIRREAESLRPLGSTWVTCMLMALWCAARGSERLGEVEEAMDSFRQDSLRDKDARVPREQVLAMWRRLSLVD